MINNKRKFKCNGCGEERICYLETNQEKSDFDYMLIDDLKCLLDETNQTSFNWEEIKINKNNGKQEVKRI